MLSLIMVQYAWNLLDLEGTTMECATMADAQSGKSNMHFSSLSTERKPGGRIESSPPGNIWVEG